MISTQVSLDTILNQYSYIRECLSEKGLKEWGIYCLDNGVWDKNVREQAFLVFLRKASLHETSVILTFRKIYCIQDGTCTKYRVANTDIDYPLSLIKKGDIYPRMDINPEFPESEYLENEI